MVRLLVAASGGWACGTGAVRGGGAGCGGIDCDGRGVGAVGCFRCAASVTHGVAGEVSCAAAVVLAVVVQVGMVLEPL
eukprot:4163441-Alexandrium_andersonii.AAC.1